MGLLLFGSSCSPSFKIGETSAIFLARGKMLLVGETFITYFNNRQDGREAVFNHASREFYQSQVTCLMRLNEQLVRLVGIPLS